jgi:hypothetical protein
VSLQITDTFVLSGIAFGTIVTVVGWHLARVLAPPHMRDAADVGTAHILNEPGIYQLEDTDGERRSEDQLPNQRGEHPGDRPSERRP